MFPVNLEDHLLRTSQFTDRQVSLPVLHLISVQRETVRNSSYILHVG